MTRLDDALHEIRAARAYTIGLLETVPVARWFEQPAGCVTHVAWQVGHIAFGEYRLVLSRARGVQPDDEQLISSAFQDLFRRGSVAESDAGTYPRAEEIRSVFDRVHEASLAAAADLPEGQWDAPLAEPHRLVGTKLGVLFYAARHEAIHAGQIGLLRRLLGMPPAW